MTENAQALLSATVLVFALVAVLALVLLRFVSATRNARRRLRDSGSEAALLSVALQDAVNKLKAQERATSARAVASEQLSSRIVENLTAGLLVVDAAGRIETLNPAGRRLLEVSGDPVGMEFRQRLAHAQPLVDVIADCQATGDDVARQALQMPDSQHATHLGVTASALMNETGVYRVICLFTDLTNVRELEEQLRLKETLAQLGEFTAGLAHEFRNGLATIHGYGRLLDPKALPEQYQPYVDGIRQETEALGTVVANFLNFARPTEMTLVPVELGPLVHRVASDIEQEAGRPGSVAIEGSFGTVEGDDVLLRQAFANLVRNALQACAAAGSDPRVVIDGEADAGHGQCRVSVLDNGPGIVPADRKKLFVPFFTTRRDGTGLGLAIVQKIVVTHRGRVNVGTSRLGGAQFDVLLPALPLI